MLFLNKSLFCICRLMIRWNRWNRIVNMAVVHFRRHADASTFDLVFRYQNPVFGVDRVFNLQRNLGETICTTLNRIKTNVEKEHNKKLKKLKKEKKGENSNFSNEFDVDFLIEKSDTTTWFDVFANVDDHEFKTNKLIVGEQEFPVAYNHPYVNQLTMPSVILVDYDCYPAKFDVIFTERDKCTFEWYKGLPIENKDVSNIVWTKCEQDGFFYRVQPSDIRHHLKVFYLFFRISLCQIDI